MFQNETAKAGYQNRCKTTIDKMGPTLGIDQILADDLTFSKDTSNRELTGRSKSGY
jgi:hypothetical protein